MNINEVIENDNFGLRLENYLTDYLSCLINASFEAKT
jgi:hypothetical protein